jgi:hypothetical protein
MALAGDLIIMVGHFLKNTFVRNETWCFFFYDPQWKFISSREQKYRLGKSKGKVVRFI